MTKVREETRGMSAIKSEFDEICRWIKELGLLSQYIRLTETAKCLASLSKQNEQQGGIQPSQLDLLALSFSGDLEIIYRAFKNRSDEIFTRKLDFALCGPLRTEEESLESDSNSGRNYLFELLTAALFEVSGFKTRFDDLADVSFAYLGQDYYVSCKRPWAKESANGIMKKALKDIKKNLKENPEGRWIMAFDVNRLLAPHDYTIDVTSYEDANKKIDLIHRQCLPLFRESLSKSRSDKILALLLSARFLGKEFIINRFTRINIPTLQPLIPANNPYFMALEQIANELRTFN